MVSFPMLRPTGQFVVFCALALFPVSASPQTRQVAPLHDTQAWADLTVSHALSENTDVLFSGGIRWGRDVSRVVYRRLSGGLSFRCGGAGWLRYVTISPFYSHYAAELGVGSSPENRTSLAFGVALPLGRWTVSERNTVERRFRDPKDSTRYRNRLQLERSIDLASASFRAFVSDEVFYDWSASAWARNRFLIGARKPLNNRVSLDLYYVRQNDRHTVPRDLHAFGIALNARF